MARELYKLRDKLKQIVEVCQEEISINEIEMANLGDLEKLYLEGRTDLAVEIENLLEEEQGLWKKKIEFTQYQTKTNLLKS